MSAHIDQLKQQISQIDELARTGALPAEQASEARAKLEKQLVEAVMAGAAAGTVPAGATALAQPPAPKVSTRLKLGMLAFATVVAVVGYKLVGSPSALHIGPRGDDASAQAGGNGDGDRGARPAMNASEIANMVDGLKARLAKDPENAEGWGMLARTYAALERFDEAVATYRKALSLRPDDADMLADFADALAMVQGRKLAGEPAQAIEKALEIDPKNFKALSLAGTVAFEHGKYKEAATAWAVALERVPADNPALGQQLRAALAEARDKAGLPPLADQADARPAAATDTGAKVSGTVSLSPAFQAQVSPDDTVFIFARAADGPKMPLAIVRKQVKDLPVTFSLDDSMAMSPQMKLSGFPEVIVGARVSRNGQAMPQNGDFAGQSAPVKVGSEGVKVEIASTIQLN